MKINVETVYSFDGGDVSSKLVAAPVREGVFKNLVEALNNNPLVDGMSQEFTGELRVKKIVIEILED